MKDITILREGLKAFNLETDERKLNSMNIFADELLRVNEFMNLTAITDENEVQIKHFLDSLSLITTGLIKNDMRLIDIGCGAGFPSMPLKIYNETLKITMLDGLAKRINFLKETAEILKLTNIEFIHGRAEELSHNNVHREAYDIATARGVANMSALCEYALPFVKVGGYFLAMKGPDVEGEVNDAKNAIGTLGGKLVEIKNVTLPGSDITHSIVIIKKISQTLPKYPRKQAQISKKPL